jgi:hypothetical protein
MKNLVVTLLGCILLAGCGGGNGSGTGGMPSNAQLNGNWPAVLTSTVSPHPLVEDFFIAQNGGTLSSDNIYDLPPDFCAYRFHPCRLWQRSTLP